MVYSLLCLYWFPAFFFSLFYQSREWLFGILRTQITYVLYTFPICIHSTGWHKMSILWVPIIAFISVKNIFKKSLGKMLKVDSSHVYKKIFFFYLFRFTLVDRLNVTGNFQQNNLICYTGTTWDYEKMMPI